MLVAEAIARQLKASGIERFFYVTGGMPPSFYSSIADAGIEMILCRNEKGASNMADGYSRVTNKPSVCYAQHGAAAAILASMLYEAMYNHSPVVALTGSLPTSVKDRWLYQDCDELPFFESTCKFNADVTDPMRLPEYVGAAIQNAVSGCPGPTHVNIHSDIPAKTIEIQHLRAGSR